MKHLLFVLSLIMFLGSCSKNSRHVYTVGTPATSTIVIENPDVNEDRRVRLPETGGKPVNFLPNATAFRMSGDYSKNIAVTLSPSGELLYFPAPTDITADSEPINLGEGWWLNCQGIGPNSVFTRYTFAEYAELPEVPTEQQLKLSIIPGAKVTEFIELPMKLNDALNNLEEAKNYVKKQ